MSFLVCIADGAVRSTCEPSQSVGLLVFPFRPYNIADLLGSRAADCVPREGPRQER